MLNSFPSLKLLTFKNTENKQSYKWETLTLSRCADRSTNNKKKKKQSRIKETLNLLTNANRISNTDFKKNKSFSLGDLVKRGLAAVHSTAEHWSTFLSIDLHCTSFLCNSLH